MSETPATNLSATQLRILFAHRGEGFSSVTWSPDSRMIATSSSDSNIRLWDIESGELMCTLEGHQGSVWSVAWSGDGQWLASGAADRTVRLWAASSGRLVRTLEGHQGSVWSVAWSGDGRLLASSADDQIVRVWNVESGTELAVYQYRYSAYQWLGQNQAAIAP
jgi:WD40 repeat protein